MAANPTKPPSVLPGAQGRDGGLRGRLWVAFVLQIAAISVATLLSVYGAWVVLRDVLIQNALMQEAQHYWERLAVDPGAEVPDTYNMHGYLGRDGDLASVPASLREFLPRSYHAVTLRGSSALVYVSEPDPARHPGLQGRLYLVFEQEQVDRLALWFGFVPLTMVLAVIYITTWLTYRVSRRAVSPVIWLAGQVRAFDPKKPDLASLEPGSLPADADEDIQVLAGAIHSFASRLEEFIERERNFTRDASHELRSPITVIKVAADILLEEEALSEFGRRSAQRIRRAIRDMEALIEAFLILAREADVGLPEEDFVVGELIEEEVERAQDLVQGKPVEVRYVREADFALHAPPRVLAVMVSNLLRNACLYTTEGAVTVTLGRDFVRVEDTGPGMSEEVLDKVGRLPFFRGDQATARGGHGVGLTIVRRLSDRFGWPVEMSSRLGVGTRATIRFPSPQPL
ncbi:MAG: sensor histidine kinase [Pseudomonadota bacterium]